MEVVYEGIRLTTAQIVNAALEEGVHVVGLSISDKGDVTLFFLAPTPALPARAGLSHMNVDLFLLPLWEKARMRGTRIYARKKSFYTRPLHPNPLPQGERELHPANKISYARVHEYEYE